MSARFDAFWYWAKFVIMFGVLAILVVILATSLVGCDTIPTAGDRPAATQPAEVVLATRVESVKATIAEAKAELAKAQADLSAAATQPGANTGQIEKAQKIVTDLATFIDKGEAWLSRAEPLLEKIEGGDANIEDIVATAAPLIPQPWGTIVGLGVGIIGLIRARQNRIAARKMAEAIEQAQNDAGLVNFDDPLTRETLTKIMGPEARRIVDEAQGKARALPL